MENTKFFVTSDIWLATALVTLGHSIKNINRSNPQEISFAFEANDQLLFDIEQYQDDLLLLQPQRLRDNFKYLKSLIFKK